jgi:hypothetical protein
LTTQSKFISLDKENDSTGRMEAQSEKRGPGLGVQAFLGAILVIAQCLAVAHYHPRQSVSLHSSAAANLDDSLCALCCFHQHSPTVAATAVLAFSPTVAGNIGLYAAQSWPLYAFNSYLLGRSPPALA